MELGSEVSLLFEMLKETKVLEIFPNVQGSSLSWLLSSLSLTILGQHVNKASGSDTSLLEQIINSVSVWKQKKLPQIGEGTSMLLKELLSKFSTEMQDPWETSWNFEIELYCALMDESEPEDKSILMSEILLPLISMRSSLARLEN